jgi:hypothetical protein
MATIHATTQPLIARKTPYPPTGGNAPALLRKAKDTAQSALQPALEGAAKAFEDVSSSLTAIHAVLRQTTPQLQNFVVTDATGKTLAALGDFTYNGVVTPNYFSEIHVGDPLNTGNPAMALFNAAGGRVTIGQNGIVEILDPFGNDAAWIGAQADTLPVTGAANNGSGLIRLTVTAHTLATGDVVPVQNVGGVPNATGIFTVTKIDANHVDLQNSVFTGAYTSGGTINRVLHITNATNAAGLIRITINGHGYGSGDEVNIPAPGPVGVAAAVGQWIITVIDASNFDLQGSTFAGAYTSGGACLRYFAGMLAQTFAVGPSFANYKLRAFADGSLRIQNAVIDLVGSGGEIFMDPTSPKFTEFNNSNSWQTRIENGELYVEELTGGGGFDAQIEIAPNGLLVHNNSGTTVGRLELINSKTDGSFTVSSNAGASVNISGGSVDASVGFKVGGSAGINSSTAKMVTAIGTAANGVFGTPGAGQSNGTVVTAVTLTTPTFTGGLRTA